MWSHAVGETDTVSNTVTQSDTVVTNKRCSMGSMDNSVTQPSTVTDTMP